VTTGSSNGQFYTPSPYCAWCGKLVELAVVVAGVVVYHLICWERQPASL